MKQLSLIILGISVIVGAVALVFTVFQVERERETLRSDLTYRTDVLVESFLTSIETAYASNSVESIQHTIDRFADTERLEALIVSNTNGEAVASSSDVLPGAGVVNAQVLEVIRAGAPRGTFMEVSGTTYYTYSVPIHDGNRVIGAFTIVENAAHIDARIRSIWEVGLWRLFSQLFIFAFSVALIVYYIVLRPLAKLKQSVQSARAGEAAAGISRDHEFFYAPLALEISKMNQSLSQARTAVREEARMRFEKLDTPWTAARLQEFVKAHLKGRPIYVVTNREPYVHRKERGAYTWSVPASGVITALESVMAACGGTWLAHGSGSADKETADADGKLKVPPDEPKYTLKRIWLNSEDVKGYYTGFSNEALWPLCHLAHHRPIFRESDWKAYRRVNGKFAKALLDEIKDKEQPIIFVQDYHFALLPAMIKKSRPDAQVGIFWHIPWPTAEQFSICPWRKEILSGMLGADLIGFHAQQYCNNFMETVAKEIEAVVDFERFTVTHGNHASHIKPFPISIAFTNNVEAKDTSVEDKKVLEELGITTEFVGIGVERLDYTKGILERIKALEFFFERYPNFVGKFTFLQIASPSRESVPKYQEYAKEVHSEVDRINQKLKAGDWKPIHLEHRHFSHDELAPLYRFADVALVTSLHDGMNLVAKEYVAAKNDESGALVLSQFTGASRNLPGAIIVNPYSAEETAEAIHRALTMQPAEQHRRMKRMQDAIKDYNVYRWSAEFLKAISSSS